jgi:stage III sporulation protein AH
MIIRRKSRWKSSLYLAAVAIILLLAGYGVLNQTPDMNTAAPAPGQEEGSSTADNLLSEQEGFDFFAEYRMARERVRSKEVETLKEVINKENSSQEARDAAALRLVKISEDMEKELKTESLIKSRGFEDCAVIIQGETTTVVLMAPSLRMDQEEELKKVVGGSVQCSPDSVFIITRDR